MDYIISLATITFVSFIWNFELLKFNFLFFISRNEDCRYVASSSKDTTIKIWDLENGECIKTVIGHSSDIYDLTTVKGDLIRDTI